MAERSPFDAAAQQYDAAFTARRLGRWLRAAVWAELERWLEPGQPVLELNCGTGEDALWLARRGHPVLATDSSAAMLEVAHRKAEAAGLAQRITVAPLDLAAPVAPSAPPAPFVLSNFGGLNCVADRAPLARFLAEQLPPGGRLLLVVMGPLCVWELAWHGLRGQPRAAIRRWRGGVAANVAGETVRVWYPSPQRLARDFAPHFRAVRCVGIGTFLPPSYLADLVERWPRLFGALAWLDRRLGVRLPWLADHYLLVLERAAVPDAAALPRWRVWAKRLRHLWFRRFERHRYDRLIVERVGGLPLLILPGVFNPALFHSGAFLAETLAAEGVPPGSRVLDMGSGSGIGALAAARLGAGVVAVDVNPAAVRCTRLNALLHQLEARIEVREGDLFAPVMGQRFDRILFNPPFFRGTPRSALDRAWRSEDVVERFAAGVAAQLVPGGHALVVLSTDGDRPAFLHAFACHRLTVRPVAERELGYERLTVYRVGAPP